MKKPDGRIRRLDIIKKMAALSGALLLLGYIAHLYTPSVNSLISQQLQADWRYVVPAVLFFLLHTIVVFFSWYFALHSLEIKITPAKAYVVFITSALTRYLPGGVWHIGSRLYALTKSGAKASHVSLTLMIEQSTALIFCLLTALIFFLLTNNDIEQLTGSYGVRKEVISLAIVILLLMAYPKNLLWLLRKTMKIFKDESAVSHIGHRTIAYIYLLNSIALIFYALGYYYCMLIYNDTPTFDFSYYAGTVLLATFIGFITPFVPGGVGVRESFLVLALATVVRGDILVSISVLPRLLIILTEISMFIFSAVLVVTKRHAAQ